MASAISGRGSRTQIGLSIPVIVIFIYCNLHYHETILLFFSCLSGAEASALSEACKMEPIEIEMRLLRLLTQYGDQLPPEQVEDMKEQNGTNRN